MTKPGTQAQASAAAVGAAPAGQVAGGAVPPAQTEPLGQRSTTVALVA